MEPYEELPAATAHTGKDWHHRLTSPACLGVAGCRSGLNLTYW